MLGVGCFLDSWVQCASSVSGNSLPAPDQASCCSRRELAALAHTLVFDPKYFAAFSRCHQQFASAPARDFLIREPILKLHAGPESNRLKTISRLPVPQHDSPADLVAVENLAPARSSWQRRALS